MEAPRAPAASRRQRASAPSRFGSGGGNSARGAKARIEAEPEPLEEELRLVQKPGRDPSPPGRGSGQELGQAGASRTELGVALEGRLEGRGQDEGVAPARGRGREGRDLAQDVAGARNQPRLQEELRLGAAELERASRLRRGPGANCRGATLPSA